MFARRFAHTVTLLALFVAFVSCFPAATQNVRAQKRLDDKQSAESRKTFDTLLDRADRRMTRDYQTMETLYAKYDAAYKSKDIESLLRFYAPVVLTEHGKPMSKAKLKTQIKKLNEAMRGITIHKVNSDIKKIDWKGNEATVTVTQHIETTKIDPRTHKSQVQTVNTDKKMVWEKHGRTWLIKSGL